MIEVILSVDPGQLLPEKVAEYARMPELTRCRECRYWEGGKAYGGHWCSLMGPGCGPEFYCANAQRKKEPSEVSNHAEMTGKKAEG